MCAIRELAVIEIHNFVDSLVSGWSNAVDPCLGADFASAVFAEGGKTEIDFLNVRVLSGRDPVQLEVLLAGIRANLPDFCRRHDTHVTAFRVLSGTFEPSPYGHRVRLTVEGHDRRRSTVEYAGLPLRRVQVLDGLGRRRPKPALEPDRFNLIHIRHGEGSLRTLLG